MDLADPGRVTCTKWWSIFRELRDARSSLGLKAHHLNTLAALLSFLKAGSQKMMVFASNRSILDRLNGVSERTLQRHIIDLESAGLLQRQYSPNRKRFRILGAGDDAIAFGFDLTPLLHRESELKEMAHSARERRAERALIRQRILTTLDQLRVAEIPIPSEHEIYLVLRRQVGTAVLAEILTDLSERLAATSKPCVAAEPSLPEPADNLTANANPDVGEYQKSKTIRTKMTSSRVSNAKRQRTTGNLETLVAQTCGDALTWLQESNHLPNWPNIVRRSGMLASWVGIAPTDYQSAIDALGHEQAAGTVLWIVQSGDKIHQPPAYFRSITTGSRAKTFCLERVLRRRLHQCAST